jgi:hypothetical protein
MMRASERSPASCRTGSPRSPQPKGCEQFNERLAALGATAVSHATNVDDKNRRQLVGVGRLYTAPLYAMTEVNRDDRLHWNT